MSANFNIGFLRTIKSGWLNQANDFKNYINNNLDKGNYNELELQHHLDKLVSPLKIVGMNWLITFYGDLDVFIKRKLTKTSLILLLSCVKNTELYIDELLSGKVNYSLDIIFDWMQIRKDNQQSLEIENFFDTLYRIPDNIKFENLKKEDLEKFIKKIAVNYQSGVAEILRGEMTGIDVCIGAIKDLHSLNYKKGFYPVWVAILGFLSLLKYVPDYKNYIHLVQEMSLDIRRFAESKPSDKSIKKYLKIFLKNDYKKNLEDNFVKEAVDFFNIEQFKLYYQKSSLGEKSKFNKHEVLNNLNEMLTGLSEIQKGEGHKKFNELNLKLKDNKEIFLGEGKTLVETILQASLKISVSVVDDVVFEELYAAINIAIYYLEQGEQIEIVEACKIQAEKLSLVLSGEIEKAEALVMPKIKSKNNMGFVVIDNILNAFDKTSLLVDESRKHGTLINFNNLMDNLGQNLSPLKFLNLLKAEEVLYKIINDILYSIREKDEVFTWDDFIAHISALNIYLKGYKNGVKDETLLLKVLNQKLETEEQIDLDALKNIIVPETFEAEIELDTSHPAIKQDNRHEHVEVIQVTEVASTVTSQSEAHTENTSIHDSTHENHEEVLEKVEKTEEQDQDDLINKLLSDVNQSTLDYDVDNKIVHGSNGLKEEEIDEKNNVVEPEEEVPTHEEKSLIAKEINEQLDNAKIDDLLSSLPQPEVVYAVVQKAENHDQNGLETKPDGKLDSLAEKDFNVGISKVLKEFCNDSDLELAGIYFEEGIEKLNEIQNELNNYDVTKLPVVRRAFHTLKGSGRMAGFKVLGEAAMHAEYFLNWIKDNNHELNTKSIDYLLILTGQFRDWFESLINNKEANIDMSFVLHLEHLKGEYHHKKFINEDEEELVSHEPIKTFVEPVKEKINLHKKDQKPDTILEDKASDGFTKEEYLEHELEHSSIHQVEQKVEHKSEDYVHSATDIHEKHEDGDLDLPMGSSLQDEEEELLWDEAMTAIQIISQQFGVLAKTLNKLMNK